MATTTTRLAMRKAAGTDTVNVVTDLDNNWDALDAVVGLTDCTSTTRPSVPFKNQLIRETDTGSYYVSNGSAPASASWVPVVSTEGPTTVGAVGSAAPLRMQTTSTIAGNRLIDGRKQGDANAGLIIDFDGRHQWGPGGATAPDTNLYRGGVGVLQTDNDIWVAGASLPRGIIGGRQITGVNNLGGQLTTTETEPTNMDSGNVSMITGRRYKIWGRYKAYGSVNNDTFLIRLRVGASAGIAGTQIHEQVYTVFSSGTGYTLEITSDYEPAATATQVFSVTAIRLSGTGYVQFTGGATGSIDLVGVWVEDVGPANKLTTTAS